MNNLKLPAFPPSSEYIKKYNEGYYVPSGMSKLEHFSLEILKSNIVVESSGVSVAHIEDYLGLEKDTYDYKIHWTLYLSKISIDQAKSLLQELSNETGQ